MVQTSQENVECGVNKMRYSIDAKTRKEILPGASPKVEEEQEELKESVDKVEEKEKLKEEKK